jgi:hypothetical protein
MSLPEWLEHLLQETDSNAQIGLSLLRGFGFQALTPEICRRLDELNTVKEALPDQSSRAIDLACPAYYVKEHLSEELPARIFHVRFTHMRRWRAEQGRYDPKQVDWVEVEHQLIAENLGWLHDADPQVRIIGARKLGIFGEAAANPPVLNRLLELVNDQDIGVRLEASQALGKVGHLAGERLAQRLESGLQNEDGDIVLSTVLALRSLLPTEQHERLAERLLDVLTGKIPSSETVKSRAADELEHFRDVICDSALLTRLAEHALALPGGIANSMLLHKLGPAAARADILEMLNHLAESTTETWLEGIDLRLMSVADRSGIPEQGAGILIVAKDSIDRLYFRMFDRHGLRVVDQTIYTASDWYAALKEPLASVWDQEHLTSDQKQNFIEAVKSRFGRFWFRLRQEVLARAVNCMESRAATPSILTALARVLRERTNGMAELLTWIVLPRMGPSAAHPDVITALEQRLCVEPNDSCNSEVADILAGFELNALTPSLRAKFIELVRNSPIRGGGSAAWALWNADGPKEKEIWLNCLMRFFNTGDGSADDALAQISAQGHRLFCKEEEPSRYGRLLHVLPVPCGPPLKVWASRTLSELSEL